MDRFDLGGGAAAALDGAVHVPLPLETGVLAGEKEAAECAGPADGRPEALRELKQRFRGAAITQPGNRLVLLRRQRRRDRHAPENRRGEREERVVARDLRDRAALLETGAHFAAAV